VVRDPKQHYRALVDVLTSAQDLGLGVQGGLASPLLGPKGNREFLAHLRLQVPGFSPSQLHVLCAQLAGVAADHP
jgi:23S rRNA (cytidine1920-2'-O)/16S rRNA (cytidine1409-2'-O)-methyltransferase